MTYANNAIVALTNSIEQSHKSDPALERWLERLKDLQRQLALRVLYLSRYVEELPENAYASYADAVSDVLKDPALTTQVREMSDLQSTLEDFVKRLKDHGQYDKAVHLSRVLETIAKR